MWEGGGEYNVVRGLRRCCGLRTAVVTTLADNAVGRLVEDLILQGGVDTSLIRWVPDDGIGRTARNGLDFVERDYGIHGALGVSDRAHTAVSQLRTGDVDWDTVFAAGVRWFHTGGIFAGLSDTTVDVADEAMAAARRRGVTVSYDPTLAELRDQGVIGAIGAGMNQSAMLARFLRETAADVVMPAGRYTFLDQSALDDVLPAARELGKSVVAVGVFNSGLLSRDRPAEGMKYDYRDAPPALVDRARAMAEVCEAHGTTLPAAAIAFPNTHPSIIDVTLGMRTAEQVGRNVELHGQHVPDGLWDDLRTQGLIRSDVLSGHGGGRDARCL
ncbi:aldo/keto reductase [Streptomyces sp. NPDC014995]|uniref:aldo/keto reductase n=1 Tax=Streptomyces sp. NPDC014995 TaxID=3364936 RepID=UPI0036FB450D